MKRALLNLGNKDKDGDYYIPQFFRHKAESAYIWRPSSNFEMHDDPRDQNYWKMHLKNNKKIYGVSAQAIWKLFLYEMNKEK